MILFWLYLRLILSAVFGMAFSLVLKQRSINKQAGRNNIEKTPISAYLKEELSNIIGTMIVMVLFFLFFGQALDPSHLDNADKLITVFWLLSFPLSVIYGMILSILCATIGYSGQDIALRLFGKVTERVYAAIESKSREKDISTNTSDVPTPATPIK